MCPLPPSSFLLPPSYFLLIPMPLLIDGYNLLHVTGIVGPDTAAGTLQSSRLALLNFLAASIDPAEVPQTTIVFDAHGAPPGLPQLVYHRGMTIRFAQKHATADDLIEELVSVANSPRRLTVVSSDHRIQRAARRRRAKAVNSETWYAELIRRRRAREEAAEDAPARPAVPLLEEDVNYWLRQFGGESALSELLRGETASSPPPTKETRAAEKVDEVDLENPFPPGYGEDLLREL